MEKKFPFNLIRKNVRVSGKVIATLTYVGTNQRGVVSTLLQCLPTNHDMLVDGMNRGLTHVVQCFVGEKYEQISVVRIFRDKNISSPNNFLTTFARNLGKACEEKTEG